MSLEKRTYSVLVVSSAERFCASISKLLPESTYHRVDYVYNSQAAKRATLETSYDFVIINAPLADEFGTRFAIDVSKDKGVISLLIVKTEVYDDIYMKVYQQGVFCLPKPASTQMILQALQWMASARERLRKSEKKTSSIEDKMAEIRIVNRAKWLLIENLSMTEDDAHKYIERQAMDRCVTKKEIAENIIKTYQ